MFAPQGSTYSRVPESPQPTTGQTSDFLHASTSCTRARPCLAGTLYRTLLPVVSVAWHFSKHLNGNTDKRSIVASFQDAVTLHPARTPDLQFFLRLSEGASLQVFFYIYLRELVTKLRDDLGNKSAFVLSTDRPTNQPTNRLTDLQRFVVLLSSVVPAHLSQRASACTSPAASMRIRCKKTHACPER